MKKSHYFSDLGRSYSDEVDDLVTDSEGKSVLQKRLNDKRREIDAILPMVEFSPEMVAVVFYGAFGFKSRELMLRLVQSQPGGPGFPAWAALRKELTVADWAETLVKSALKAEGGDAFLVATAGLEFLRTKESFAAQAFEENSEKERGEGDDDGEEDDDGAEDLREAGADWLAEQGFEPLDR